MKGGKLLGLFFLPAFLLRSASGAEGWTVLRHQGRDYVTFANLAQFYQFPDYTHVNRAVSLRSARRGIRAQAGTNELYINGVRFFTNFPILSSGGESLISAMDVTKIVEPVLRPSRIQPAQKIETVVLDPGHGGTDQGSANQWGTEKGFALEVAAAAREPLVRAGFKVEMTRSGDTGISLEERVNFANKFSNALFISIHFNTAEGGAGVESYALAPGGVVSNASSQHNPTDGDVQANEGNAQDGQNMALSAAIHASILSRVSAFDRGVRHARFAVLRHIKIPAVLIEGGFLSDPAEGQRIATAQYRQKLGGAIAQGVQNYNAAVNYRSSEQDFVVAKTNLPPHAYSISEPLRAQQPIEATPPEKPSVSISGGE